MATSWQRTRRRNQLTRPRVWTHTNLTSRFPLYTRVVVRVVQPTGLRMPYTIRTFPQYVYRQRCPERARPVLAYISRMGCHGQPMTNTRSSITCLSLRLSLSLVVRPSAVLTGGAARLSFRLFYHQFALFLCCILIFCTRAIFYTRKLLQEICLIRLDESSSESLGNRS